MLEKILLGTYTKRESKGIYEISLDTEKKELVNFKPVITETNPTYVGVASDNHLYSMTIVDGNGGMAAYKPEPNGGYSLLNAVTEEGAPPCYVGIDNDKRLVFGANYHKGQVLAYRVQEDGTIQLVDKIQHEGSGPHDNQKGPHAHYTDLTPDKRLVACDLGTDGVYTYDIAADGKLTEVAVYQATPGTGPRHLVFHPNGEIAYLFGELANTVVTLSYDATTGKFETLQTISTIPADFTDFNGGAAIRISQDGKFVYASNRGHDSIAVFKTIDGGKALELVQLISSEGHIPRDFALNSTDEFVVVAHQESDNLTLFSRDSETGQLTLIQKDVYAPECVCTYFVK